MNYNSWLFSKNDIAFKVYLLFVSILWNDIWICIEYFFSKKGYKDANFTNNIDLSIGGDNNINY